MAGYLPIQFLRKGDLVLTHEMRWRAITERRTWRGRAYVAKGYGHPELRLGGGQGLLARRRQNFKKSKVGPVKRNLSAPEWTRAIDLSQAHHWATPTRFQEAHIPPIAGVEWPSDPLSDLRFAWLCGFMTASASITTGPQKRMEIHASKDQMPAFLENLRGGPSSTPSAADLFPWTSRQRDYMVMRMYNRTFARWTEANFGRISREKRLPGWILGAPAAFREAFLDGHFAGDGEVDQLERVAITTSSRVLAHGLRSLIESLGNSVTFKIYPHPDDPTAQMNRVRWRLNPRIEHTELHDDLRWMQVKEMAKGKSEILHSLSVEEDGSYVAEGIIAHGPSMEGP